MKNVRPIVAMNSEICGWLTSGRSTKRSISRPSTTITASVASEREPERQARARQADERQRGEEHHRALREVEHARRLVDQHEAERDERVHDAGQQPADQHFEEERIIAVGRRVLDCIGSMGDAQVRVDHRLAVARTSSGVPSPILRP